MSSLREARSKALALLTPPQLQAVHELIDAYEAEQTEDAITGSDREAARVKVLAARDLRESLKVRPERAAQAGQA